MGKRVADRQLTQLNQNDNDEHDSSDYTEGTFRMADKDVLARRAIRKPKSRLRDTNTSGEPSTTEPSSKQAFSAFSGFGAKTQAAPASTTTTTANMFGGNASASGGMFASFSFGSSNSASAQGSSKPAPAFGAGAGAFRPSAFGSSFGPSAKPATSTTEASSTATSGNTGLAFGSNASSAFGQSKPASAAFQPAKDLGETAPVEQPKDKNKPAAFSMPAFKPPTSAASAGSSLFGSVAKKPAFSSGFMPPGGATSTAATSADASLSTKPTGAASGSTGSAAAAFAAASPSQKDSAGSGEEFYKNIRGLNVSLQKKIGDAITANAFVDLTPLLEQYRNHWEKITKSQQPAAATTTTRTTSTSTAESILKKQPEASAKPFEAPAKQKSVSFDSSGSATKPEPKSADTNAPQKPLLFGAPSAPSAGSGQLKFSFGATANSSSNNKESTTKTAAAEPPKSGFSFSFGKPGNPEAGDAAKKPFSFGFAKPAASESQNGSPAQKPVFSFGFGSSTAPAAQATKGDSDDDGEAEADGSAKEDEDEEAGGVKEPTNAGEEGETTEHQTRAKLYMWDGAAKKYKDLGVGNLKVNSWETDSGDKRARLICRQEGSDKLTLNAAIFKEMNTEHTAGKKEVGILVITDGKPTRYLIRTKNGDVAKKLYDSIEQVKSTI